MAMTLVRSCEEYSTYLTPNGNLSYIVPGWPFRRYKVDLVDLHLEVEYRKHFSHLAYEERADTEGQRAGFIQFLRAILNEPEIADDIEWCTHCSMPSHEDDTSPVYGGEEVACDTCIGNFYTTCSECGVLTDDTNGTLEGHSVCEHCYETRYGFCAHCDGAYHLDNGDDHNHDEGGVDCCTSPALEFFIRNDGAPALAQDTLATITLPAGIIDAEGLQRIYNYLYGESLYDESALIERLGGDWQTKEGNYTKRFSRLVYKELGRKVSPDVMSMIGTIGGDHSQSVQVNVRTTRDLNRSARDLGNSDSCWWQSYSEGRCALKSNGGFGLLAYHIEGPQDWIAGRAWVLPLKLTGSQDPSSSKPQPGMVPTFDTMTPTAFAVFNGYGTLSGWAAARVLAHMAGMTYRKIGFGCEPMFVNSDMAYLVAPEDIAAKYTDRSMYLSVAQHSTLFHEEQQQVIDLTGITHTVREYTHA